MAPTTRSRQPRRKVSSSTAEQRPDEHDDSQDQGEYEQPSIDEDVMDTDEPIQYDRNLAEISVQPLRHMAERIGKEVEIFAEELDKFMHRTKKDKQNRTKAILTLVDKYKSTAEETVARLRRVHGSVERENFTKKWSGEQVGPGPDHDDLSMATNEEDLERWKEELHTWNIIHDLMGRDELDLAAKPKGSEKVNDRFTADKDTWQDFLRSNVIARERLVVIRWLESIAEVTGSDLDIIEEQLVNKSDKGSSLLYDGWMDTRERIKAQKRLRFYDTPQDSRQLPNMQKSDGMGPLVTQLDPDSVIRQGRSLEKPDEAFEKAFWTICWEMLRRGYGMNKVREWCAEKNELARAFSIGAQRRDAGDSHNIHQRWLWRQACTFAARNGLNNHERGVYGLLCGVGKAIEPLCRGWPDYLFLEYNSRLLQQYESYLATHHRNEFSPDHLGLFKSPNTHQLETDRITAAQEIVASLELNPASRISVSNRFQRIQAALIGHRTVALFQFQGIALARRADPGLLGDLKHYESASSLIPLAEDVPIITDDYDVLRVMAHLYIICKEMGVPFGTEIEAAAAENPLRAYIECILHSGKYHLIPLYAAQLDPDVAIEVLARCLPEIKHEQEQQEFANLMLEAGIDVPEVLTTQAQLAVDYSDTLVRGPLKYPHLLEQTTHEMYPELRLKAYEHDEPTQSEMTLIRAMKWFLLIEGGWVRMFVSLTSIAIQFLQSGRISAALELYRSLPFEEISIAKKHHSFHQPVDLEHDSDDNIHADDVSDDSLDGPPPLGHGPSLSTRSQRYDYRNFGIPSRAVEPEKARVFRALHKVHARTYFELGQLVEALRKLYAWREAEQELLMQQQDPLVPTQHDSKKECRKRLDFLVRAMEPLLHGFLSRPSPHVIQPAELTELRRAFVPQMVLAYAAALHCAGHLLSRDHLLQCLDLATDVADNEELIADFKADDNMATLVDTFAYASKGMLKLNEGAKSKNQPRKRGGNGRTYAIWEVQ